ncbi:hypothetical protein F4779DRAFT_638544 [Xylariaceae sp. FL0662B]|nr:hypothetical protein F4779DRAFT_638544 [Xylariaceae sp. FL0662B]
MNERFHIWDALGISHEEQVGLARLYGFNTRPTSQDGHLESVVTSQSQASPRAAKGVLRKTRSGRIAKTAPKKQRSGPRARHFASTHVEPLSSDQSRNPSSSDEFVKLGNNTTPKRRQGQRNTHGQGKPHKDVAAVLSPPQSRLGHGREVKSAGMNAAEESKTPPPRRSTRIAQRTERAERAKQFEVAVKRPTRTTRAPKAALGKPKKPRATLTRGTDTASPARGGRSSKTVSSKASKPQGIVKRTGRPRKNTGYYESVEPHREE